MAGVRVASNRWALPLDRLYTAGGAAAAAARDSSLNPEEAPMEKVRLDLESLEVDSFATDATGAETGTVRAHQATHEPAYTCGYTCGSRVHFLCCTG